MTNGVPVWPTWKAEKVVLDAAMHWREAVRGTDHRSKVNAAHHLCAALRAYDVALLAELKGHKTKVAA